MWSLQPGSIELDVILIPGDHLTFLGPCLPNRKIGMRLLVMPLRYPKGQLWVGSDSFLANVGFSQGGVETDLSLCGESRRESMESW